MVQTGMTSPYTAFAQQNGGPGAPGGDPSSMKPDMKVVEGGPPGGGGVPGGSPGSNNGISAATQQAIQALQLAQHAAANGVLDQQNATVITKLQKLCGFGLKSG
jgi:hypothetical protein